MGWFGNANFHRAQVPFKIWLLRSDKEGQYARVWQCFKFGFPGVVEIKYLNLGFNGSTKNSIASVFGVRCVKIMAAEHTYKLLLTELKKRKREDGAPPGNENEGPAPKAKAGTRRSKAKAKGD
jgi:hypothetical protein